MIVLPGRFMSGDHLRMRIQLILTLLLVLVACRESSGNARPPTERPVQAAAVAASSQVPSPTPLPTPSPAPSQSAVTGRELLAYLRATAPHAGGGPYDWLTQAVTECVEGDDAPRTAIRGAACFERAASRARQRAAELHALTPPASLAATHRALLALIDAEEHAVTQVATQVASVARMVDRRRRHQTWSAVWGGEEPYIAELDAARHIEGAPIQAQLDWVAAMNRECDRVLRCENRDAVFVRGGRAQIRCHWRTAVDALTGEEASYSVVADSDSTLPACDGTRAPCHDPPGGFRR